MSVDINGKHVYGMDLYAYKYNGSIVQAVQITESWFEQAPNKLHVKGFIIDPITKMVGITNPYDNKKFVWFTIGLGDWAVLENDNMYHYSDEYFKQTFTKFLNEGEMIINTNEHKVEDLYKEREDEEDVEEDDDDGCNVCNSYPG